MSVFRVPKTKNFTIVSNHHLRNMNLSLKAKGLLSVILSLPDNWDYTLAGLACISKEGLDAIRGAINELEQEGYIVRNRVRDANGQLGRMEYTIYETPQSAPSKPLQKDNVGDVASVDKNEEIIGIIAKDTPDASCDTRNSCEVSHNQPVSDEPDLAYPIPAQSTQAKPTSENPILVNRTQLITYKPNTNLTNTNPSIYPSINPSIYQAVGVTNLGVI